MKKTIAAMVVLSVAAALGYWYWRRSRPPLDSPNRSSG